MVPMEQSTRLVKSEGARRKKCLVAIIGAAIIYVSLLSFSAQYAFSHHTTPANAPLWISFGFSAITSLMFLAVGSLILMYTRKRLIATLLFCFCFFMMVIFTTEAGAVAGSMLLSILSGCSSIIAIPLLSILLMLFPKNHLALPSHQRNIDPDTSDPRPAHRGSFLSWILRSYLVLLTLASIIVLPYYLLFHFTSTVPSWWNAVLFGNFTAGLFCCLICVAYSYTHTSSLRDRQQIRLFVVGVLLTVGPLLFLTVLPQFLKIPYIEGQYSTFTTVVFPLALGYSLLRYQLLVIDSYIRRAATWTIGIICLTILTYLTIALCGMFFSENSPVYIICVAGVLAILAPCTWWGAKASTEHFFFTAMRHYRRLIEQPTIISDEELDINKAAQLFTATAMHTFETSQVGLFVLDESCGIYQLFPTQEHDLVNSPSQTFIEELLVTLKASCSTKTAHCLGSHIPVVEHLARARRPLLLRELTTPPEETPTGLDRYLAPALVLEGDYVLLAPVRSQGRMIGILALGECGDHQPYAGPDFEAVQLLVTRFSSLLETARLYARANQHTALLNNLYSASAMPEYALGTIDEVARKYAMVAANAIKAAAEIWLYDEQKEQLRCITAVGPGPRITSAQVLTPGEQDWATYFFEGEQCIPPCLPEGASGSFTWLPLQKSEQRVGVLVLTYPGPHLFLHNERHALEMFAQQCAVALENARITLELHSAYKRLQELDRQKDRFIMTASHELRTPLTTVQGYVELLSDHLKTLSDETRNDFLAKARRGCDELTLMVNNIMDASRVHRDAISIKTEALPLLETIIEVLEIFEIIITREQRTISVRVSSDMYVMADDTRLRQILHNLISNALKYSPAGTTIEITAETSKRQVQVQVRDYGAGVLPEDQGHLFERFVRLERDINSPVRGAGLGLYISKQLTAVMGGRIWVESSGHPGDGSAFVFTLPLATLVHAHSTKRKPQKPGLPLLQQDV